MYFFSDKRRINTLRNVLTSWVGTPYSANCRMKGKGVDCAGFVSSVMVECNAIVDFKHPFCRTDLVDKMNSLLMGKLENVCDFVEGNLKNGDIPIFEIRHRYHLGVYCDGFLFHVHKGINVRSIQLEGSFWDKKIKQIGRLWEHKVN